MHIYPNIEPIDPPIISKGKNIPPGAPEPKLIIENNIMEDIRNVRN